MALHTILDVGEELTIGESITIKYSERKGRKIRITIFADRSLKIGRKKPTDEQQQPKKIDSNG